MTQLSRREFAALAGATFAAPLAASQKTSGSAITAQDVADRIRMNIGVEWKPDSIDGVKAGQPSTTARGIVTTSMATLDVLQRAVKAGSNIVITSLPTFYSRTDARNPPAGRPPTDRIFTAKNDFIAKHDIVVFRLSEHWRWYARSARAGHGAGFGVDEISTCRRCLALRGAGADAGNAGRQCEETLSIRGRGSSHRRSPDTRAADRPAARDDADPGGAQDAARSGCHHRRRSARMGVGRIRARQGVCRARKEGSSWWAASFPKSPACGPARTG